MATGDGGMAGWAIALAEDKLAADVPRRWAHTHHCVERARAISGIVGPDADLLVTAVALHDIGFSPDLGLDAVSEFPLYDAVRYLVSIDAPRRVVCLVANHANARIEAPLRGYGEQMAAFEDEGGLVRDGLWYSCLTTGPDGQSLTFDQRVEEWLVRYADDPVMGPFTDAAVPELRAAVARVEAAIERDPTA
jgi:hypothetical protein